MSNTEYPLDVCELDERHTLSIDPHSKVVILQQGDTCITLPYSVAYSLLEVLVGDWHQFYTATQQEEHVDVLMP